MLAKLTKIVYSVGYINPNNIAHKFDYYIPSAFYYLNVTYNFRYVFETAMILHKVEELIFRCTF